VSIETVVNNWQGGWAIVKDDDGTTPRYISFGERLEGPGTDSFGVAEDKIFCYSNFDEVMQFYNGHADGWRMVAWLPVEVGAHVASPSLTIPMQLIDTQGIINT
jgi:hypothetical protein